MRLFLALFSAVALLAAGACSGISITNCNCGLDEVCAGSRCLSTCELPIDCESGAVCDLGICIPPDLSCQSALDCPAEYACSSGICVRLCNTSADCVADSQVCISGACVPDTSPECRMDFDCQAPPLCREAAGAQCTAGHCVYPAAPDGTACDDDNPCTPTTTCDDRQRCVGVSFLCDGPPASECVGNTYRSYAAFGVCNTADGTCDYAYTDFDCPDCASVCLPRCETLRCDETEGGCQSNGTCVPEDPPRCQYQNEPDGKPCDRPGDTPGSLRGTCSGGRCMECATADDCVTPPSGVLACYAVACNSGFCEYVVQTGAECAAATCSSGILTAASQCTADGSCLTGEQVGCGGYQCNASGTACLTSCSSGADCVSPYECNAPACESPGLGPGEPCSSPGDCNSGYCANGVCCSSACDGLCEACGSDGVCDEVPSDDIACGTIDCDGLDVPCRDYHDLTDNRCAGLGVCKDAAGCDQFTDAASGDQPAGCSVCQECDGSGGCGSVLAGETRPQCDAGASGCSGADACDGAGNCDPHHLADGAEGDCPACQDCDGSGSCRYVASGQQDAGCSAGATGCSGADACNGSGGCNANHLPNGAEGDCPTCQDCDGNGSCRNVGSGQQDNGCRAGATGCSGADTCNGSGGCDRNHLPNGAEGNCPTCQDCNGNGSCRNVASGQQDNGCRGTCESCNGSGSCGGGSAVTCWADGDGDGYGNPSSSRTECGSCTGGYVTNNRDCHDGNSDIHPGQNAWFTSSHGGGWDYNCNGSVERQYNSAITSCWGTCFDCSETSGTPGCGDNVPLMCGGPGCGGPGNDCVESRWVTVGCH